MPGIARAFMAALASIAVTMPAGTAAAAERPVVAVAANMKFAVEEIGERFGAGTGRTVVFVFGSSGNIVRQVAQGAPYQLFLSADEERAQRLVDDGRSDGPAVPYAIGRLVIFAATGSPLAVDSGLDGLARALADGRIRRFAIANPALAPYGRAAEEALRARGLWPAIATRLVIGETVAQAAQFATTGAAEGGIFAYSLALAPGVRERGAFAEIPETAHAPIRQSLVLLKGAGETARAFRDHMLSPAAGEVLRRHGYLLPGKE